MTFRSLYRLEKRGLLDCPILGVAVDDWTVDQLKERARESIVGTGEKLDEKVFERLADRFAYVAGDFDDAATYESVAEAIDGAEHPVFYLEIPPFLFGSVVQGLSEAGLTRTRASWSRSRSGTTPRPHTSLPSSSTSTSTSRRSTGSTTTSGRWASRKSSTSGSRTRCSSRSGPETTSSPSRSRWRRSFGVEDRGHFYDPVGALRDVVVNHLMQVVAAAAMESPSRREPDIAQGRAGRASSGRSPTPTRRTTSEASTTATSTSTASLRTRTTETYAALRLEIENWRWAGVPFFIRTGKRLPATQTELRLVFKHPAAARVQPPSKPRPEPNQLVSSSTRRTGIRLIVDAHSARRAGAELDRARHGVRTKRAGRARLPTRCCCTRRWSATRTRFTRQDGVEETWRIMQPLLDNPPPVNPYAPGRGDPRRQTSSWPGTAAGSSPWMMS